MRQAQAYRYPFRAMGSPCELWLYAQDEPQAGAVASRAKAEIERLERVYSRYRDDSLLSRINQAAGDSEPVTVDTETAGLLDYAATAYDQSDGLFDITSGILRRAWDFKSGECPDEKTIQALLPLIGWDKVEWIAPHIRLPVRGMELDFGGFVKEYAVDAVVRLCRDAGLQHGMVDLGGDIGIIGPHPDGQPWQVGIRHPRQPDTAIARIGLQSGCLASSGDYERYMEVGGKRYCHILNPKTGWPCEGLAQVSVAAPLCLLAGTASTIAMLQGKEAGIQWLSELGLPYFWVTGEGQTGGTVTIHA